MRLLEAILDANHRAVAGDENAGLHPAEFAAALPLVALTCADPRLNEYFPNALGVPGDQFIWLRNAGNIITGPLSGTARSLALACAVEGGREIAIIGHADCPLVQMSTATLIDRFKALGVERGCLPDNVNEFFGAAGSERQNVIKACDFARQSPLLSLKVPVHGLLLDLATGKLDWVVNGYETLAAPASPGMPGASLPGMETAGAFKGFDLGEMKFPEMKIGEAAAPVMPPPPPIMPVPPEPPKIRLATPPEPAAAGSAAEAMERFWPKPPLPPSPLPPMRKPKPAPPPPVLPRPDLHR